MSETMKVHNITLFHVELAMRNPFSTHQGSLTKRPLIIVKATDESGNAGWGEVTAFPGPFYTSETIDTAWHILKDFLLEQDSLTKLSHPSEFSSEFSHIQGHQMAKAGLEAAYWDLFAKQRKKSLKELLGGSRSFVKAGAVINLSENFREKLPLFKEQGYERYKLKVEKGKEKEAVAAVKELDSEVQLMIDANGAYNEEDLSYLASLDELGLLMLEQPFPAGDFYLHSELQKRMKTPVCLDESVMSLHDAKQAVRLKSCQMINIKISRVGGLSTSMDIHNYCMDNDIPVWCGGMVESGISKAHNLALASLANFTVPGDLSSSERYFFKDLVVPPLTIHGGRWKCLIS
ncbi:o-succinylbenzoate synthase [Halobacillus salinarum]|uniref:o-succinylbenzoate synthase n=1 Tax=Halobacillus salinarum TaxID=2932257 RepID=A0ABY4EQD7_9BACI|nr:o-succinylbenzoate synthase [Halobacillus salinarum]UOQ46083.1 o-succinylbenzoate synthase [Halobacillus salinarum]